MNSAVIDQFQATQMKAKVAEVRPGETVKVHYKIREGGKERIQIFEGLVIGTKATKSFQGSFTVRKVVDGVGVERTFPFHSPWVTKVERVKSGKVRRAKLNFVREYAMSRRFKLKDKGVEGAVWDEPVIEKPEASSQAPEASDAVAKPEESADNKTDVVSLVSHWWFEMTFQSKALGATGESWAERLLKKKKFRILKRNFRTKFGEIDILAGDGKTLVIVEVKAKTSDSQGAAIEMITPRKREKLILLAHELMMKYKRDNIRIDVVTVDSAEDQPVIKHHKGIIEFNG